MKPVPELRDALEKSIEKNQIKNVKVLPFAAGSQAGLTCFNLDALNSGNNWIATGAKLATALKIPTQRLDTLSLDRPIDFVKIDVQGWEIEVLKGMSGLIRADQRPIIMCEIHKQFLEVAGASVRELGQLLLDYHYELCFPRRRGERIEMEILSLPALEERAARTLYFDIIARPS